MNKYHFLACWFYLLTASTLLMTAGCNSEPVVIEAELPEAKARLMDIKFAYFRFIEKSGRPPHNEKELLRTLEVENPEETLLSPRDGKPFVICYGVNVFGPLEWAKSTPVLAYEQVGDGSHWVLSVPGAISQLDEETFQKASFPPGHTVKQ